MRGHRLIVVIAVTVLLGARVVYAALGESVTSVKSDQTTMHAGIMAQSTARYTMHELTLAGNTTVREYVSPQGVVFAVTWRGTIMPNLRQLLGSYASTAETEVGAYRAARGGGPGAVATLTSNFVFQSVGHPGFYVGRAYLQRMIPPGVTIGDIQ
ncbi:DUF2844 domain-containing protein [Burkholderia ubonensis]|uniref:DUF2844 domain-containing protein n=1 Tax=Burkholderia ubonensis TaxID=101571 RepID=UPI000A965CA4|nr:DUF2844 domain-containing protein [Burkholderia ubonensis]